MQWHHHVYVNNFEYLYSLSNDAQLKIKIDMFLELKIFTFSFDLFLS